MMGLVTPRHGLAPGLGGMLMAAGFSAQSHAAAESRTLANKDLSEPSHDTGEDHSAHAAGRICTSCGQVIGAGQPARRRGEDGWVHDVCLSPVG